SAARLAISERRSGVSDLARARPPAFPAFRARASSGVGVSSTSPVAMSTIRFASWFVSRGRFGRSFGMGTVYNGTRPAVRPLDFKLTHYRRRLGRASERREADIG